MAAGWAALAGAANAYTQRDQQARDDERWNERYQIMQRAQADAEKARMRYMAALKPPETEKISTTNDAGKPVVQTRQWMPPSDEDIAAGKQGQFSTVAETPDINFDRLAETQRHNQESEEARQRQLDLTGQLNAARMEAAAAKGAGSRDKGFSFTDYATATPEQRALYDRYRRGEVTSEERDAQREKEAGRKADFAARVQTRKDLSEMRNPTDADKANALYENQVTMGADPFASVKGGASSNAPMSQFDVAAPAPAAKGHGRVVRTGTKNGRRVVQYEDGTIDYAQ